MTEDHDGIGCGDGFPSGYGMGLGLPPNFFVKIVKIVLFRGIYVNFVGHFKWFLR